jgi:phosphonate transport system permease protein
VKPAPNSEKGRRLTLQSLHRSAFHFQLPKSQIIALVTDWGALLYLAYCVSFLINHWFRVLVPVSPAYHVPFPTIGYVITVTSTFVLAVMWENLGESIGWKALGLIHTDSELRPLPFLGRLRRLFADLAAWVMAVLGLIGFAAPLAGLATLFYGLTTGDGISCIPGLHIWAIDGWTASLWHTLVLALAVIGGGAVVWTSSGTLFGWLWPRGKGSTLWIDRVVGARVSHTSEIETTGPKRRWWRTSWGLLLLLLVAFTVYVGSLSTEISITTLIRRASRTGYLWKWLATPDFQHFVTIDPDLGSSISGALIETVFMALIATVLGLLFAFPISFLGARNVMATGPVGWVIYTIVRGFFNIVRSIETIIWAVIFAVWVNFGPFAGVLALTVHTIAALGKLFSEQVEAIDPGPLEAIATSGGRRWQIIRFGAVPQIIPSFLAFTLYRWDINVRMSTVIGLVGGGGIGRILFYYKNEIRWHEVGAVIVVIVAVVWLMDYVSGRVRERIQ